MYPLSIYFAYVCLGFGPEVRISKNVKICGNTKLMFFFSCFPYSHYSDSPFVTYKAFLKLYI